MATNNTLRAFDVIAQVTIEYAIAGKTTYPNKPRWRAGGVRAEDTAPPPRPLSVAVRKEKVPLPAKKINAIASIQVSSRGCANRDDAVTAGLTTIRPEREVAIGLTV
jgi:hypothetical protein